MIKLPTTPVYGTMPLSTPIHDRIAALLNAHPVVLFMKGTRTAPKCGFSASAATILNELLPDYCSVDVLADDQIRAGIKEYGNWPTIPQLYVRRELIGGADIIQGLYGSGELHEMLGVTKPDRTAPTITITDAAADAIRHGLSDAGGMDLHLSIDARFEAQFHLRPARAGAVRCTANGLDIYLDPPSAGRANGIAIDWVDTPQGSGLAINNPNAPPRVQELSVHELKRRQSEQSITTIDVRPAPDRARAPFGLAEILDESSYARLAALPKTQPLAFLCHHGNSSRDAAEHFRELGFRAVFNIEGGIDAWSREIDPSIPRY